MTLRFSSLLVLVTTASAAAADTLLVGPPESGAPFTSIQAAVDAAQPGDAVCVLAGTYVEPAGVLIDKPLSLLGAGSGTTVLRGLSPFVFGSPKTLEIAGLAAGEEVRVAGIALESLVVGPFGQFTVARVSACAGPVILADVTCTANGGIVGPTSGAVHVQGSSQVLLQGCSISGGLSSEAQPALRVESSSIHVTACTLVGGSGAGGIGTSGTEAILALASTVRLSATSAVGGFSEGITWIGSPGSGDGGPGLRAEASAVHVRAGSGGLLAGSAGSGFAGVGASAVVLDAASVLTTDAGVELAAGADGDGEVSAPVIALGGGAWSQLTERLAGLTVDAALASPGGEVAVEPSGAPAGAFLTAFSLGQSAALAIPGVAGLAVLDVQAFALLATSTLDAGGGAAFAVAIPPVDELAGVSVLLQGLCVGPSGLASFSAPSLVAIVP